MKSLEGITNYLEISLDLHTAGQPSSDQLPLLKAAGMDVVINLATPTSPNAIPDEHERVNQLGMEYILIPVVWEQPTTANLDAFFATMKKYQAKAKFVHCVLNMRVSAFVYLYRVLKLKEAQEDTWQDVLEIWQPEGIWDDFIRAHLR